MDMVAEKVAKIRWEKKAMKELWVDTCFVVCPLEPSIVVSTLRTNNFLSPCINFCVGWKQSIISVL